MSDDDKVRVRARGTALDGPKCPDFDAADRDPPVRRKIGCIYKAIKPGQFAWVPTGADELVAKRAEVARAIAAGDLYAADEATAAWAYAVTRVKVTFDPTFGGATAPAAADVTSASTPDKADKAGKAGS